MNSGEVSIIGTINAVPYKLGTYPYANLTMTILVVDIPPRYGCCCKENGVQPWGVIYSVIYLLLLSMLTTRL